MQMIHTIYSDTQMHIKIDTFLKHCVYCGRLAQYIISYPKRHYGWRLCWEHIPRLIRIKIKEAYING